MEFLDIFDKSGKHLGKREKEECHIENAGVYHKTVHVWIINNAGEILIQKRADFKRVHPSKWAVSASGHVDAGEELVVASQREIQEELGIIIPQENIVFIKEILNESSWEFSEHFIVNLDINLEDLTLQAEEVSNIKWVDLKEFKELWYSDKFVPHTKEYKDSVFGFLQAKVKDITKFNCILTSNGFLFYEEESKVFKIIKEVCENKTILLVGNATLSGSNIKARDILPVNFGRISSTVVTIYLNNSNLKEILNYPVVYIMGGDIGELLKLTKNKKFRETLLEFFKKGGVAIGESAGSMLFAKDLTYAYIIKKGSKPKYHTTPKSTKGLDFVDKEIIPHADKLKSEIIDKCKIYEKENNREIAYLKDGEYILKYIDK